MRQEDGYEPFKILVVQCSRRGFGEKLPHCLYIGKQPLNDGLSLELQGRFSAEPGLKVWPPHDILRTERFKFGW